MMDAYLGPLGALVSFKCPSALEVSAANRSSLRVTLGGRVKEFRAPRGRRQWSVGIGTVTPSEMAGLSALVDGFYGRPPWVWVGPWQMITNLLSPGSALLEPGSWFGPATLAGAGVTADGTRFGRSIIATGDVGLHARGGASDRLPVVPGVPVTGSVYASGAGYLRLVWVDSAGTFISSTDGPSSGGTLTRRSTTAVPPSGAAAVQVTAVGLTQITMPAFTWTPSVEAWAAGSGCNRATVDGLSEAVQLAAMDDSAMRRSAISFTVQELG